MSCMCSSIQDVLPVQTPQGLLLVIGTDDGHIHYMTGTQAIPSFRSCYDLQVVVCFSLVLLLCCTVQHHKKEILCELLCRLLPLPIPCMYQLDLFPHVFWADFVEIL